MNFPSFVKKIWQLKFFLFFLGVTALFVLLLNFRQVHDRHFPNDIVAWVLPANAVLRNLGSPYKDYWDIKPPGLIMITSIISLISPSLAWFNVVNVFAVSSICFFYWWILRKLLPIWNVCILYCFTLFVFFSPTLHTQLFPSEINGLFFSLLAVVLLLSNWQPYKKLFWALFVIGLAGQMKETFSFTFLAAFPFVLSGFFQSWAEGLKRSLTATAGLVAALMLIVGFLQVTGSYTAYQEVLAAKSSAFGLKTIDDVFMRVNLYRAATFPNFRFIRNDYNVFFISVLTFAALIMIISTKHLVALHQLAEVKLTISFPQRYKPWATVFCYWIGMWIGYALQNRFGSMYDLAVLFSTFMLMGMVSQVFSRAVTALINFFAVRKDRQLRLWASTAISIIFLVILTMPPKVFASEQKSLFRLFSVQNYIDSWKSLENPQELSAEHRIRERTEPTDCIEAVYGWAIGSVYHYAERKPCARHFIPNIITENYISEYQRSIAEHPPAAIYYTEAGADLNIPYFEGTIVQYQQLLKNCYRVDSDFSTVFWPKPELADPSKLQHCVKQVLTAYHELPTD